MLNSADNLLNVAHGANHQLGARRQTAVGGWEAVAEERLQFRDDLPRGPVRRGACAEAAANPSRAHRQIDDGERSRYPARNAGTGSREIEPLPRSLTSLSDNLPTTSAYFRQSCPRAHPEPIMIRARRRFLRRSGNSAQWTNRRWLGGRLRVTENLGAPLQDERWRPMTDLNGSVRRLLGWLASRSHAKTIADELH